MKPCFTNRRAFHILWIAWYLLAFSVWIDCLLSQDCWMDGWVIFSATCTSLSLRINYSTWIVYNKGIRLGFGPQFSQVTRIRVLNIAPLKKADFTIWRLLFYCISVVSNQSSPSIADLQFSRVISYTTAVHKILPDFFRHCCILFQYLAVFHANHSSADRNRAIISGRR